MKISFHHIYNNVLSAVLLSMVLMLSGCCTQRRVMETTTTIQQSDSTDIEVRIEKVIEYQTDTVLIEIPAQTAERTTQDSISHLENDYAVSDARINLDGSLFHDLRTKPQKKAAEFQKPIEHRDSVRTEYKTKTEFVTLIEKQEIEKEFTWWQQTCIKWFPWSLLLIFISLGIHFRNPITSFFKRLFCNP